MPNTTKRLIADQVLYRLYGGESPVTAEVQEPDIYKAAEQLINAKVKARHFEITLPSGDTIPENMMIATYESVTVTSSGTISYATLPVQPISLPRNMGVFGVYSPLYPDMVFIPLQAGMRPLMRTDTILNDLFGMVTYELKGNRIVFNKNLTLLELGVVDIEMIVLEMDNYSETDYLPIPADMEEEIVEALYEKFSKVVGKGDKVDNYSPQQQTKQ